MTGYSIFKHTIADMTWLEVEEAGRRGAVMLVPVGVVEQHGPHLPLGTDIYAAHLMCCLIRSELERLEVASVIAPPYYFGLSHTTEMFPGTLSVRRESMVALLSDLLVEYKRHGFPTQFIVNHHGDALHNEALVDVMHAARDRGVRAVLMVGSIVQLAMERAIAAAEKPLPQDAWIRVKASEQTNRAASRLNKSSMHIHAEERETSLMMRWFPRLAAGLEQIRRLVPVTPSLQEFHACKLEGRGRDLSPQGYIGDPSVASEENAQLYEHEAQDFAAAIATYLAHH